MDSNEDFNYPRAPTKKTNNKKLQFTKDGKMISNSELSIKDEKYEVNDYEVKLDSNSIIRETSKKAIPLFKVDVDNFKKTKNNQDNYESELSVIKSKNEKIENTEVRIDPRRTSYP